LSFDIPPSQKETDAVRLAMSELKESLEKSSRLSQALVAMLSENFLAIDESYRKELFNASAGIDVALWDMNVALHKMRNHQSRIISDKS
jgi:hypothetical protein